MLYLEDYLELIEHLPQELRDRFTDIRERDLQVHNSTEQLKERVRLFFAEAKKSKPEQRQCDYEKLIDDYQSTMNYADEKVQISNQMHEIMIKLVQRLDTELEKFKLELEADHAGITEELEKRSLELDTDSRFDNLINNHDCSINSSSSLNGLATELPSGLKDRRRSEHKHRHHPYQNNQANGYHGRAKLSNHEHNPSKNPIHHNHHHNSKHRQGSKSYLNAAGTCRPNATSPINLDASFSLSAPASVAGDLNGTETNIGGHYGKNLSSFGNNSGFKNSTQKSNLHNNITLNGHHLGQAQSALSAALASPQLNSVSALAMMNAASVHNKISNNLKGGDLLDPSSQLVRQNPLAAAASQAIAATQQLQQNRKTPGLKASFAAINAAGLGPLDSLKQDAASNNSRNALAPMSPDQQAFRYNGHFGRLNGSQSPLYISVTKSGRPSKRPRHHASHLYPDESPTSISSDNSVFENSESLSSTDFIETGTTFGSNSPSSLDFATSTAQGGNTTLYHRDETKYCICRQISYGEMVACDNNECENEWFHYDCVGITQPPKGKWYCPDCAQKMDGHNQQLNQPQAQKKRGRKEKSLFNNLVNNSIDNTVRESKDHGTTI